MGIDFLIPGHLVALAQAPQSFPMTFSGKKRKNPTVNSIQPSPPTFSFFVPNQTTQPACCRVLFCTALVLEWQNIPSWSFGSITTLFLFFHLNGIKKVWARGIFPFQCGLFPSRSKASRLTIQCIYLFVYPSIHLFIYLLYKVIAYGTYPEPAVCRMLRAGGLGGLWWIAKDTHQLPTLCVMSKPAKIFIFNWIVPLSKQGRQPV